MYKELLRTYKKTGGNTKVFQDKNITSMVVERNKIISSNIGEGLIIKADELKEGISAKIVVKKGYRIEKPMHFCFGVIPKEGLQKINMEVVVHH